MGKNPISGRCTIIYIIYILLLLLLLLEKVEYIYKRGVRKVTLKTTNEGKLTTVYLPPNIREELTTRGWTILDAIKNGINSYSEGGCFRPECVGAKRRLAEYMIQEEQQKEQKTRLNNGYVSDLQQ